MTADPKLDAVTADHLREMARLCRPCACDYGCRHDVARGKIHDLGGWHTIAMKLLDEADELRTELAEARGSAQSAHAVCFAAGISRGHFAEISTRPYRRLEGRGTCRARKP